MKVENPPAAGSDLDIFLGKYRDAHKVKGKGEIATMIFASRFARNRHLPFDVAAGITTDKKGQVKGLGVSAVQAILAEYGINQILAKEGGRTSRGSLGNIGDFLTALNERHRAQQLTDSDLPLIEAWWVDQADQFFRAKPFRLRYEPGNSLQSVISDLLSQAQERHRAGNGTMYLGTMLQHLVGATLALALPDVAIPHFGSSVADASSGRVGDFKIGDTIIHVTTAPGEPVLRVCLDNIHAGLRPIVVTLREMLSSVEAFAGIIGIEDRVDAFDVKQFIVGNLYGLGGFDGGQRQHNVNLLIDKYNEIVAAHETDPSLQISRS
jgi:hypothetical protein